MEGIRYYLPRPFLNVFESFPVRTDIYLANGVVTPDRQGILIRDLRSDSALADFFTSNTNEVTVPRAVISRPAGSGGGIGVESESIDSGAKQGSADAVTVGVEPRPKATGKASAAGVNAGSAAAVTGQNSRDVRNDNGAYAYQPMRGNMDIAYLPDFEEQYAVSSRSGLGNAKFALNLGQGWSLQGLNSLADNQELNKRIFDIIDSSVEMAKAAAKASMGIPPVPGGGLDKVLQPAPERAPADLEDQPPGTPVTLKIVVVHYAAKGLYPVIKPRELQERLRADSRTNRFLYLNLHKLLGQTPDPVSAFDPAAIKSAQQSIDNETRHFAVPRYPYQYVGFQTFRYMAIEVVRPDAKPFETLYDRTGTQGPAGAVNESPGHTKRSSANKPASAALDANQLRAWTAELKSSPRLDSLRGSDGDAAYQIADALYEPAGRLLTVSLTIQGNPAWVSSNRLSEVVRQKAEAAYQRMRSQFSGVALPENPIGQLTLVFDDRLATYLKEQGQLTQRVAHALGGYRRASGANAFIKVELVKIEKEEPLSISVNVVPEGAATAVLSKAELEKAVSDHIQNKMDLGTSVVVRVLNADDAQRAGILK